MHGPRLPHLVRDKSGIQVWVDLKLRCVVLHCSFGVQWLEPRALSVSQDCSVTEHHFSLELMYTKHRKAITSHKKSTTLMTVYFTVRMGVGCGV